MASTSLDTAVNVDGDVDEDVDITNGRWNKLHRKRHMVEKIPRRGASSGSGSVFVLLLLLPPVLLVLMPFDHFVMNCKLGAFIATNTS